MACQRLLRLVDVRYLSVFAVPKKLIAVVGPTGTGKSDLGVNLALSLIERGQPAEIVNVDSMQFYRGMDIGTAKRLAKSGEVSSITFSTGWRFVTNQPQPNTKRWQGT